MKINWNVRAKSFYFWLGIISTILLAANIKPETLTSWSLVGQAFINIITNPFTLVECAIAVLGNIVDHTTPGLSDSTRALSYDTPGHIAEVKNNELHE